MVLRPELDTQSTLGRFLERNFVTSIQIAQFDPAIQHLIVVVGRSLLAKVPQEMTQQESGMGMLVPLNRYGAFKTRLA